MRFNDPVGNRRSASAPGQSEDARITRQVVWANSRARIRTSIQAAHAIPQKITGKLFGLPVLAAKDLSREQTTEKFAGCFSLVQGAVYHRLPDQLFKVFSVKTTRRS